MEKEITIGQYLQAFATLENSLEKVNGTSKAIENILRKSDNEELKQLVLNIINEYVTITSDIGYDDYCYYTINALKMPKKVCRALKQVSKKINEKENRQKELELMEEKNKAKKFIEDLKEF